MTEEQSTADPQARQQAVQQAVALSSTVQAPSALVDWKIAQLFAFGTVRGAMLRYRAMAYIVGVGLFVLVFVGVPLQYAANQPLVVEIVGPIHGIFYMVYLLVAFDLARRARLTLWQLVAMIGAGFLPFLAFIIEHYVTKTLKRRLEAFTYPAAGSDGPSSPALGSDGIQDGSVDAGGAGFEVQA